MKIFIVDDDVEQRMIMADFLDAPENTVLEFDDGEGMLANLDQAPDLILLDIEMPRLDGITACRRLREMGHDQIQIIFISAHDDMETRLTAYAAGGSDFVVKPFMPADLLGKISVARSLMQRQARFASDIQFARKTAFTAMSSMGELGVAIDFLRKSFACENLDEIATLLMTALQEYGLASTIELRSSMGTRTYSSRGDCSPLEQSILSHAQKMGRIFRFRGQLAVTYPQVTFVIMNLPADEDYVGRLHDHLSILAEGADARIGALDAEVRRMAQACAITHHVEALGSAIQEVDQQSTAHRAELLGLGQSYLEELTRIFAGLGLSESQENALYALAERANLRAAEIIGSSNRTAAQLRSLASSLQAAK